MKLRWGAALALLIALACAAVGVGAYRGWIQERAAVEETYAGLTEMLEARVEAAYNLLVVARRHLDADAPEIQAVARERDTLENAAALSEKAAANAALTRDGQALLDRLSALESVRQDERDKMYVDSFLPQLLAQSEERAAGAVYNTAARAFNQALRGSFSGKIASLLGVKAAEEFIAE